MDFVFVSGNLALDLAGTLKWRDGDQEEQLSAPGDLAEWAVSAGVLTEAPQVRAEELQRLKDLREAVYRLADATIGGRSWPARDIALVNELARGRPPQTALSATGMVTRLGDAEAIGWAVATAMIDLVNARPTLRKCNRDRCTRLFVDRSRTGNRRWCGMGECGNRIKAAEYRARKKSRAST